MKRFWDYCKQIFSQPASEHNEVRRARSGRRRRDRNRPYVSTDTESPGSNTPAPNRTPAQPLPNARASRPPSTSTPAPSARPASERHPRPRRPAPPPPPPQSPLPPTAPPSDTLCRVLGLPVGAPGDLPRRQDPEYEMFQQLSCSICLDLFTDPLLLPCLHSLCRACCDTIRAHSNPFLCPECKHPVGQEPLRRNFPLNNMVDIFKRDAEARKKRASVQATPVAAAAIAVKAATAANAAAATAAPNSANAAVAAAAPIASPEDSTVVSSNQHSSNNTTQQPAVIISISKCAVCASAPSSLCCVQCKMAFCDTCLIGYHPTVETTPEHTLIPTEKVKNHPDNAPRLNVQGGLCDVMGSMMRVHAEMLQTLRRRP